MQPQSNDQPPTVPPPAAPTNDFQAPQLDRNSATTAHNAMPEIADDGDLIEKEWVTQAKQIIQTNTNDPHEQNAQFTKLRATYLQKRYGKQLKVGD